MFDRRGAVGRKVDQGASRFHQDPHRLDVGAVERVAQLATRRQVTREGGVELLQLAIDLHKRHAHECLCEGPHDRELTERERFGGFENGIAIVVVVHAPPFPIGASTVRDARSKSAGVGA